MLTGVIRSTVVTLSKNDDITAVNKHKQLISGQTFPLVIYTKNTLLKILEIKII